MPNRVEEAHHIVNLLHNSQPPHLPKTLLEPSGLKDEEGESLPHRVAAPLEGQPNTFCHQIGELRREDWAAQSQHTATPTVTRRGLTVYLAILHCEKRLRAEAGPSANPCQARLSFPQEEALGKSGECWARL